VSLVSLQRGHVAAARQWLTAGFRSGQAGGHAAGSWHFPDNMVVVGRLAFGLLTKLVKRTKRVLTMQV
jgi:hypothetical protein